MKKGLTIIIPACREEKNLRLLLPQILTAAERLRMPCEVLVVDTQEPLDRTAAVCRQYGCRCIPQRYPKFGGAYRTGIGEAAFDKCLFMDADGSHDPRYIPKLAGTYVRDDCDVVIGSRYVRGGASEDALSSVILSRLLNLVFRAAAGTGARDSSSGFRLCRTELLRKITLEGENFDIQLEMLVKMKIAAGGRLRIREVPIVFHRRKYGESKREWIPFFMGYARALRRLAGLRFSTQNQGKAHDK